MDCATASCARGAVREAREAREVREVREVRASARLASDVGRSAGQKKYRSKKCRPKKAVAKKSIGYAPSDPNPSTQTLRLKYSG